MSTSYKQLSFVIFIWMLTLGQCLTSKFISQENDRVIIIDQDGTSDLECCMYGNCHCSNLSLALEHIQDNTEIRIQSGISLHNAVVFGNVSNVKITGDSNPTVRCDHQGGLVGMNINYIVIQDITWDSCSGITMLSFTDAHIIECNFLNFINFALTLHGLGSVNINGSTFCDNSGNIDVLAPYITIHGSKFYGNSESGAIVIKDPNFSDTLALHSIMLNATIERCEFSGISEHCVHCIGNAGLLPNLLILSSNFTNNMNTAVNVEHCNITLNNVTFYNNVNVNSGYINDGGAIRVYNGTVNMTGNVFFYYNRAGNNGGAICLNHSVLYVSQGPYLFHNNTADNGGAIYIGKSARLHAILNEASLEFLNNSATSSGGAVYVDLHYINDATFSHQLSSYYYYNLLTGTSCTCDFSNTADIGNCAYFNMLSPIILNNNHHPNHIAAALSCFIDPNNKNSTVYVNVTDITDNSLKFWTYDLHLAITMDCYDNPMSPVNISFQCCDITPPNKFPYNCIIDTEIGSCVVTGTNTIIECLDSNTITCIIETTSKIPVTVQRFGHICDDIAHVYFDGNCLPICSEYSSSSSLYSSSQNCWSQDILPGYWYDNGFIRFVVSCPIGRCNQHFDVGYILYTTNAIFPDRDLQCNGHWGGLACGECDYSAGYAIKYDTTECVPVDECLTTSVTYSLLILFVVSFFYWIVIISFIFVLLHFKFDITAGYAYGLLFYYSVLDQLVNDVTNLLTESLKSSYDGDLYYIFDNDDYENDDYEFMRLEVLPFLSSIGNLKPPFTGFMNLCLGEAKMIDHLILGYIHPLIVTFLVIIIFILTRNFVVVARIVGRFINSKSICILLLLSYSSITYTSMQLLKPLPVFKIYTGKLSTMQVYWSPTVKYFHGRHLWYGTIAILCELIIGIGFPLVLIFQRYLTRYCNINFTSIKPIIDQLKGCYKEEYRWFAAYYLICRQVLYGVNNLFDYCSGFWVDKTAVTPFAKFIIVLIISVMIMVIHIWVQPYKKKSLNVLDNCILLTLVGLLVNSLEIYWDRMISVIFWFLPLIILINYLTCFTKLKYLIIPCSCAAVFFTANLFGIYYNPFVILLLASSFIIFIVYIVYVIKCLCTRCRKIRPRYVAINEQNDEVDTNNNDSNATEVSS